MDKLNELCVEYVRWVLIGFNGGGYTSDMHRRDIHDQIGDILHTHSTKLKDTLGRLDKEVGLPIITDGFQSAEELRLTSHKYGDLLFERLKFVFKSRRKGDRYEAGRI